MKHKAFDELKEIIARLDFGGHNTDKINAWIDKWFFQLSDEEQGSILFFRNWKND